MAGFANRQPGLSRLCSSELPPDETTRSGEFTRLFLTGASYDPPTASNGWVGTVDFPVGSSLPFGLGAMTYIFSAMADGVSVDAYDPGVDMSSATNVFVDGILDYTGLFIDGLPLALLADIAITSVSNQANTAVVLLDGNVHIDLDGYLTDLDVSALTATLDLAQDEVSEVTGQFQSSIDLPTEVFDAGFDMNAIGSSIEIAVQAANRLSEFGIEFQASAAEPPIDTCPGRATVIPKARDDRSADPLVADLEE